MFRTCLLLLLSCSLAAQLHGQTKEQSEKWILSKLNKYGYRPIEMQNELQEVITPLTEWALDKGKLIITCKKADKEHTVLKYQYTIPLYAIDSVSFNDSSDVTARPAHYLRMYLNCRCAAYTYHEIISGGGYSEDRTGRSDRMPLFMLGNEEKDIKERMNKAFAYLRLYYPKPKETF